MATSKKTASAATAAAIAPGPVAGEAPKNPFAEPLEGADATLVIIEHDDGSRHIVPRKVFRESYKDHGYRETDEKPYTIEDMRAAGQTTDDREDES